MKSVIPGLVKNWSFKHCTVARWEHRRSIENLMRHAHRRPPHRGIKPVSQKPTWLVYFIYSPDGVLSSAHRFTLNRLQAQQLPIFAVVATKSADLVPKELADYCDAIFWKGLAGYDFSAYTLALREISRMSPGADVFLMNDSVFGPFTDIREVILAAPWDLTGFTSSNQLTNHIQSYAFILRGVDRNRLRKLSTVFFPFLSISHAEAVIFLQEIRLARVAARHMSVGALWYGDCEQVIDPTLARPFELLDNGFPFLKRSLLGKHERFMNRELILSKLESLGHPLPIQQ